MSEKASPQNEAPISVAEAHEEWKPRRQEYLIMITLSLISVMVALDASILTPALPVSN